MTKRECAIVMAFTGTAMLKGDDLDIFYRYISDIIGRQVYTHEIGIIADEIKESARNDFMQLCREATCDRAMTNGDRIRAMTDEELTRFLNGIAVRCIDNTGCTGCPMREGCCYDYEWMEKWMKEEAMEDAYCADFVERSE